MIGSGPGNEPQLITRRRNLARRRIFGAESARSFPFAGDEFGQDDDGNDLDGREQGRGTESDNEYQEQIQSDNEHPEQTQGLIRQALYSASRNRRPRGVPENETFRPVDQNRNIKLFISLFIFRILNGLFVNTWFDPDETWQSLEVAHQTVFKVGAMTWEWRTGIRGAAHPMIFAAVYKVIQILGLEHTSLLISGPRIVQAAFAACTDLFAFLYALRTFGLESAQYTLTCMIFSWFNFYCLSRTYSNSVEACTTMIALYFWPEPRSPPSSRQEFKLALLFAALGCIIRPTNGIIWIYMGISLLQIYPHRVKPILYDVVVTALMALFWSLSVDRIFYHRWIFTQWEFLRINVIESISDFYGVHPFHWYFTQGVPLVLFTSLPFCLYGGLSRFKNSYKKTLFWMCFFVIMVLSVQAHKEFRFLLPLVAPFQIYAGQGLYLIGKWDSKRKRMGSGSYLTQFLALIIISNTLMGFYFSRIHKRGVVHAVEWLREEAYKDHVSSIIFLMPCHSTPYYSHIHLDIPMRYITCEPPLGIPKADRKQYQDETDLLYSSPSSFFSNYFSKQVGNKTLEGPIYPPGTIYKVPNQNYVIEQYEWPSHLVWYDNPKLGPLLSKILEGSNLQECARFSNGWFHDDEKQLGNVIVSCRNQNESDLPRQSYSSDARAMLAEKSASMIKDAKIKSLDRPASMTQKKLGSYGILPNGISSYGTSSNGSSLESVDMTKSVDYEKSKSAKPSVPKRPPEVGQSFTGQSNPNQLVSSEHLSSLNSSGIERALPGNNVAYPLVDLDQANTNSNPNLPSKATLKKKAPPPPPSSKVAERSLSTSSPSFSEPAISGQLSVRSSTLSIAANIQEIAQKFENGGGTNESLSRKKPPPVPPSHKHANTDIITPPPIPTNRPLYHSSNSLQQNISNENSITQKPPPPIRPADFKECISRYRQLFQQYDKWSSGLLSISINQSFWGGFGTRSEYSNAYRNLSKVSKSNSFGTSSPLEGLNEVEFCLGMFAIDEVLAGKEIPLSLDNIRLRMQSL